MVNEILSKLNDSQFIGDCEKQQLKAKGVFIATSLHTLGAVPKFRIRGGRFYEPYNYLGPDYQDRFDNILLAMHPREDKDLRNWRFSQYKPLSKGVFSQLDGDVLGAIFQDSNYSIIINDEKDAKFILNDGNFEGLDLISWFKQKGYALMRDDPNGYFVRMPRNAWNSGKDTSVDVVFIPSFDVLKAYEEYLLFRRKDYIYYIDKKVIWRFKLDPESKRYYIAKEDESGYYAHMLGRIPADIAGGNWNSSGFYESFYSKALPVADEFIGSFSNEQMIDKEASHPYIQQVQEECHTCHGLKEVKETCNVCHGSAVHNGETCSSCAYGSKMHECPTCHGSGKTNITPGVRINVPYDHMDKDMVRIISPSVSINEYHRKKNKDLKDDIYRELNLLRVDESQSGVAKAIDQEHKDLFISKIANHIFDTILYNSIRDIIGYRNVVSIDGKVKAYDYAFQIIKPTQYRIRTADDLTSEYERALKAGMPTVARNQMFVDLMDKQYSGDAIIGKKVRVLAYHDIVLCCSEQEKTAKLANSEIDRNVLILSTRLPNILDQLILEKGEEWFLKVGLAEIKPLIDAKFEPFKIEPVQFPFEQNL